MDHNNESQKNIATELIYKLLWNEYKNCHESLSYIEELYSEHDFPILFDHISFRSLNCKIGGQPAGVKAFEYVFSILGYEIKEKYSLKDKKITAFYYEHYSGELPKLYISQFEVTKLHKDIKQDIKKIAFNTENFFDKETKKLLNKVDKLGVVSKSESEIVINKLFSFFTQDLFKVNKEVYNKYSEESEYLSWLLAFGNRPHHFAVPIHEACPKGFQTIEDTLESLENNNIPIENSIYSDKKDLFKKIITQSSIVEKKFICENVEEIDYGFIEFVERGVQKDDKELGTILYNGFISDENILHNINVEI